MAGAESFDIDGLMVFKGDYTAKDQDGNVVPSVITPDRYKKKDREPLSSDQIGRYTNTSAYWKDHSEIVPARGDMYIYSDGGTIEQGGVTINIPKIKIGDGVTAVENLPFTDSDTQQGTAGTLNTTNTSAQKPSASESLSGTVNLHEVAKTGDYRSLHHQPTIPTVNDAVLTIQKNGTTIDTFSANASQNKTINITVPTTASDVGALPSNTKYGAALSLSINSTTYVITAQLKDQDGNNLGNAQTIDLPLESVVVSGSYNAQTKKVVLTLQNGSTIEFSVADLVAGLQSEITAQNPLSADLVVDGTTNKVFTSAEKTKLSGIEAGAEVNVQSDWNQSDNTADDYIKNKPQNIVTDASYVHTDNNYTTTEKNKLAGIENGAEVNVQSDWGQTDDTADDYIKNKPSLATVATSGSYNDLIGKPTIPSAPGTLDTTNEVSLETSANEDLSGTIKLHKVSKTGDYNDLSHKLEAGDNIVIRNTHLPIGYDELQYIRNSSSTRVNTGITPDVDNIKVELVVKPTSGVWRIFQSAGNIDNTCGFAGSTSDYSIFWRYRGETIVTSSMLRNTEHYMFLRATAANGSVELYVKDLETGNEATNTGTYTYGSIGYPAQFSLFGNVASLYAASGNMVASLKFWVNDVLRIDYVPCKRIQDNVVGFYDKVTGNLITENTGTINAGTLAKNNVINVTGLAEVATSGDYNDLTNKPTIPDSTSDLTNDSGFITLSDVPAQVNADWNETDSSDPSYIANKPTIPSAPGTLVTNATTSQTASSGEAMSGTITLHKVSKTGSYSDLLDKPTIDTALSETSTNAVQNKAINVLTRMLWNKVDVVSRLDNGYDSFDNYIAASGTYTGQWRPSTTYKHWIIPLDGMSLVSVVANSSSASQITFLKTYESATGTPDYATGYSGIIEVNTGDTVEFNIPIDAMYLYVTTGASNVRKPNNVILSGIGINQLPAKTDKANHVLSVNNAENGVEWIKPVIIYSGSSSPASVTGADGDIYIQEVV